MMKDQELLESLKDERDISSHDTSSDLPLFEYEKTKLNWNQIFYLPKINFSNVSVPAALSMHTKFKFLSQTSNNIG